MGKFEAGSRHQRLGTRPVDRGEDAGDGGGMTKNREITEPFTEAVDAPDFTGRFWFAALRGIALVGCLCGFMLLGTVVAQGLGPLFILPAS
jgi:hypothetical protein